MDGRGVRHITAELTPAAREPTSPSPLDPRRPYKPLDVGNGIVAGTLAPNGRWLSLGIAHPRHGRIVLTTAPPFRGSPRDQPAVRAYRAALADPARPTFGIDLLDGEANAAYRIEDSFLLCVVERPQGRFETTTVAPAGRSGALQVVRIKARKGFAGLAWGGAMRLARAEYTQLTAGGPLPPAPAANRSGMADDVFWIEDVGLGAAAAVSLSEPGTIAPEGEAVALLAIGLGATRERAVEEAEALVRGGPKLAERELAQRRRLWTGLRLPPAVGAVRRALAYGIDCAACAVPVGTAMLADHEILPLVWTRDAYYVCRALLAVDRRAPTVSSVVEGFIRWLFDVAQRVDGLWPRAALASGQAKDPAFQLDQQLYPLLLLADHARITGDAALRNRYAGRCAEVIAALLAKRTAFGLIATAETPADDPLAQPYHFSSHVLLWRVLDVFAHPGANDLREATLLHFASEGRFAYAIAGPRGHGARHYHDANDLPTVFAPGWRFCAADDPRWRATIAFAWSEANAAYFAGALAGLGSVHTPHPWPLGDLQEIVIARASHDAARERQARERLARVETWDGLLPEAYDERTGAVASRHWFAWPVALRALLEGDPSLIAP